MLQPNIWMQIPFRFKIGICKWYLGPIGEVGYLSMLGFSVTFDLIHSVTEQSEGPMGSRIYLYVIAYTKFYQNASICSEDIEEKHILHQSRAITLLFINEFSPFAIPNHSSLISISMQNSKKIGQKHSR